MIRKKISKVGVTDEAGLHCPKCGGMSFTAKRSAFGKSVGLCFGGVGVALAPKTRVKCVTCGAMFTRG